MYLSACRNIVNVFYTEKLWVAIYFHLLEKRRTVVTMYWVLKEKVLLSELQAIVGKLNFSSKVIPGSRAFNRRFYNAMINLYKPYHHIRINCSMREDMVTLLRFLEDFNGVVYFTERQWTTTDTLQLFTGSAGSAGLGCGCYFQGQ